MISLFFTSTILRSSENRLTLLVSRVIISKVKLLSLKSSSLTTVYEMFDKKFRVLIQLLV